MSEDWNTKYGPRRVRRDPPTLDEAIFAAIGITEDQEAQAEIGKQRTWWFFADRFGNDDRRVVSRFRRGGRGIVQIRSSRWLVPAPRRSALARSRPLGDVPRVTSRVSGVNA